MSDRSSDRCEVYTLLPATTSASARRGALVKRHNRRRLLRLALALWFLVARLVGLLPAPWLRRRDPAELVAYPTGTAPAGLPRQGNRRPPVPERPASAPEPVAG
jgi:hypothetical protein